MRGPNVKKIYDSLFCIFFCDRANFGIFCSTPGIAVARSVQPKKALKMLFTGLPMSARDANDAGLVSTVVSHERLDDEVAATCAAIKHKSRAVIELGKRFFYQQIGMADVRQAYQLGEKVSNFFFLLSGRYFKS